jgi:hypothetical protein
MLQRIHQKEAAPRASSLYCKWIQEKRKPGAPLGAIWIDNEMRGFELEFLSEANDLLQDPLEEPGGALSMTPSKRIFTLETPAYRK